MWSGARTGFDELKAHALRPEHSPEKVAAVTGISCRGDCAVGAGVCDGGAFWFANGPAVIRLNYGIQRSEYGGTAARAVCMLPLLTGAWKYKGGGCSFRLRDRFRSTTRRWRCRS